jgi:hypothetical protein
MRVGGHYARAKRRRTTHGAELTEEGGAAVLRRDSGVEKGPPWPAMVSEVTGGQRSGGGVLRRGILHGPEETTVELSAASIPEQGKRKTRESRLGRARMGKRGGPVPTCRAGAGEQAACVGCA